MFSMLHLLIVSAALVAAQAPALVPSASGGETAASAAPPAGYVIGVDDHLTIAFWRDKDLSAQVVVRPDGCITLPLLNDVHAAGLTPDALREVILKAAARFVDGPDPTVIVDEIHSRRVFVTGNVAKPGMYPLNAPTTVMQLIATAGGLREFVPGRNIVILRRAAGRDVRFAFDYQAVVKGRHLQQNIELKPGDTVIVP